MKICIAFVVACVALATARPADEQNAGAFDKFREDCKKESGVEEEILKEMRKGVFKEDPKSKEFLLCVSKKVGFQNEAGEFQKASIKEKLTVAINDADKAKELTEKCTSHNGSPSDAIYKMAICLQENIPNNLFSIY